MFVHVLLLVVASKTVAFDGSVPSFFPRRWKSAVNLSGSDSSIKADWAISTNPGFMNKSSIICRFRDYPLLEVDVFESVRHGRLSVVVDRNVKDALLLAELVFKHEIDVSIGDGNSNSTVILQPPGIGQPPGYRKVDLGLSSVAFLDSEKFIFTVFGEDGATEICMEGPVYFRSYFEIMFWFALGVLVLTCLHWPVIVPGEHAQFWIVDEAMNIYYGPDPGGVVNKYVWHSIKAAVEYTARTEETSLFVTRFKRHTSGYTVRRIATIHIGRGILFVMAWWQDSTDDKPLTLECEFISDKVKVEANPVVRLSSFRDARPVHLTYTLDTQVKCKIDLTSSILEPFLPSGELVNNIAAISMIVTGMANGGDVVEAVVEMCRRIFTYRAVFLDRNGEILQSYVRPGVDDIDWKSVIPMERVTEMCYGFLYDQDFLGTGKMCYVAKLVGEVSDITTIVEMDEQTHSQHELLPFFTYACGFALEMRYEEYLRQRNEKIQDMLLKRSKCSVVTMSKRNHEVVSVKSGSEPPTVLRPASLYTDLMDGVIKEMNKLPKTDECAFTAHIVIDSDTTAFSTVVSVRDEVIEDNIIIVLAEWCDAGDVCYIDPHEMLPRISVAKDVFGFMKFEIVDGEVRMIDDELFKLLGRQSGDRFIKNVVNRSSFWAYRRLCIGDKLRLSLNMSDDKELWFIGAGNGEVGYIASLGTEYTREEEHNIDNDRMEVSGMLSVPSICKVDLVSHHVHRHFGQPTIWDVMSIDKEAKFTRFFDYIHESEREVVVSAYNDIVAGKMTKWSGEVRVMRSNGLYAWKQIVFTCSMKQWMKCLIIDVDERHKLMDKLEETKKYHDLILTSVGLSIWVFNDSTEKMDRPCLDFSTVETLEMNWWFIDNYVEPGYRNMAHIHLKRVLNGIEPDIHIDVPLMLEKRVCVSLRGRLNRQSRQIVGACVDMTCLWEKHDELELEKKRADEANASKTVFLANLSHEIRTPMNGILGLLDVMVLQNLTTEQRLLVDTIRSCSRQLMQLLSDVLDVSKIEQGSVPWNPTIFDLASELIGINVSFGERAKAKGLTYSVCGDKTCPELVYGDAGMLVQILNNLLSNALKFTDKGCISMAISYESDGESAMTVFDITDTGIGMTSEQQTAIFERFVQADETIALRFGGTGLGVPLVKELTEQMGGTIDLESEVGIGTKFKVSLPLDPIMFRYSAPFSDGREHILLTMIDDNVFLSKIVEWMEYYGFVVRPIKTANDICEACQSGLVHVIFLEGDRKQWHSVKVAVSEMRGSEAPVVCVVCAAGEGSTFQYTLVKPVGMPAVFDFVNMVRYKKLPVCPSKVEKQVEVVGPRILVVEDNKSNQFVMKKILTNIGCTCDIAENGQIGIAMLDTNPFDLVFMDQMMPVLDGLEATKIIRSSKKAYSNVPIIALTANAIEGERDTCLKAGMNGFLAKPVRLHQIKSVLNQFLFSGK